MPICSTHRHKEPYKPSKDEADKLSDIELLLRTIRSTNINKKTKKVMLDRIVWLVVESTGNFYGRYRSAGTLMCDGSRIQRDHIFTRKRLVAELLNDEADLKDIINRAQCCIVTQREHAALSKASKQFTGWERYKHASPPVVVYDMLTNQRMA